MLTALFHYDKLLTAIFEIKNLNVEYFRKLTTVILPKSADEKRKYELFKITTKIKRDLDCFSNAWIL